MVSHWAPDHHYGFTHLHQVDRIHHRVLLQHRLDTCEILFLLIAYRNAREGTREHVMSQAITCRKSFIAVARSAAGRHLQLLPVHVTHSKSSPGTASGLLDTAMVSAGSAAGKFADVATIAALMKTDRGPPRVSNAVKVA